MKELSITKWKCCLCVLVCSFLFHSAHGQVVFSDSGQVSFTSHVPLHNFTGTSQSLVGQIDFSSKTIDFYVDLATLKTGIGKRDKDMRLTLEVDTYPFAEFFGTLVSDVDLESSASQDVSVEGKFSLHGVTKDVQVPGTLTREGQSWVLEAEFSLLLNDYNIEPPKLLIMKVDDKQEIELKVKLEPTSK